MLKGLLNRTQNPAWNAAAGVRLPVAQRRVVAGFGFALACLALVGVVSYLSVLRLTEDARWVQHTRQVLGRLELFLSTTADAETAERGYVITGDEDYLEPYRRAVQSIDGMVRSLRQLTADNPAQQQRLQALDDIVAERLKRLQEVTAARSAGGFAAARREILTGRGKLLQDRIRGLVDQMAAAEEGLLGQREVRSRRSTVVAEAVILCGGAGGVAVAVVALLAIRRDFAGRRRAEEALRRANEELEAHVRQRTAELARANESLSHSERRFRALVEHGGDGVVLIDANDKVLYLSPAVLALEGYTPEELVGRSALEHTHPQDIAGLRDNMRRLLAHPGVPIPALWRRRHKNGQWIWLEGVVTNLLHDPAVQAIVTNYRDVTERKQAEARLQGQLARLALLSQITRAIGERQDVRSIFQIVIRTLEEHLPADFCCVCVFDPAENQLTVTGVGSRSRELALELALTEQARIQIDQNGLSQCVRGQLVHEPDLSEVAFPFPQRLARGGLRSMVAAPLLVESQVFGILIAARRAARTFASSDCEFLRQVSEHVALATHQAQLYGALQRAYDDLRLTQQAVVQHERLLALGKMASGIAHDINNAISPVALYTEALLEREPDLSPRARTYLETIQGAIDDVAQTVARMREFYRQREPLFNPLPVDLNRLVEQVINLTRARWHDMAQQRGTVIEVRSEAAAGLPPFLGVESEVREALTHLIFNAVDAMPEGGPLTLRTALVQRPATAMQGGGAGSLVQLEVSDAGVGMDEDTRRRCLEPFFTTKGERGTGLGLAMVYGMVQRHGADIEIDSAIGKGTTLRLLFPLAAAGADTPGLVSVPLHSPSLRILIVDDDPLVLKSLRDALEADGHCVTSADGGQAGIDAFGAANSAGEPFPVVITDLGMPYVDGRKVSSAIKTAAPDTAVILLTGWGQRLVADGEIPPHVDRVLSKPPKLRELRETLAWTVK